jgi:hypothetical protein
MRRPRYRQRAVVLDTVKGRALRVALNRVSLDNLCARRPRILRGRGERKPLLRGRTREMHG